MWTRLKLAFFKEIESFIPKRIIRRLNMYNPLSAPWFTKDLKHLIRCKNRHFKRALASGIPDHWKFYCSARNRATAAIKQAKCTHFNEQTQIISDPKCSPSKWWQVARDLCGLKGSASTCLPPLMDRCWTIVSESNAKADLLNKVFINQNTSVAPDACIFGSSPLNVTFDLGTFIRRTLITQQDIVWEWQDMLSYDEGGLSRSGWPSC